MAGDHHGAAFLAVNRDDHVDDLLQRIDGALNAAARGEIDDGVIGGGEDVAGADDIVAAEEHDAIAVGMGGGLMQDVDAFAIEVQLLLIAQERAGGPATIW